ncbi:hypothetical protein E1286_04975 [Nonomuraea terrae]|uniref:Uncharacterized protein n=1 Tax=Nonomuraea terrae TaxID=2530383 RepID=A0A4R4Z997_9ACTN|nr:hypothetical protein [Nonomuraea terrae]TDD54546.1 hypothetical protein E1286_04975 [Nonomuraea terrae]
MMATEAMIDLAVYQPSRSVGGYNADATLHRARGSEDVEQAERAAAARVIVQLVLGRHECALLPVCPEHGSDVCDCRPCTHPDHASDMELAGEALRAFGLVEHERVERKSCVTCFRSKPISQFSRINDTCKVCLSAKKKAKERAKEAGRA